MPEKIKPQYSVLTHLFFSSKASRFVPFLAFLSVAILLVCKLLSLANGSLVQPWIALITCKGGLAACVAVMACCAFWGSRLYRQHPLEATSDTIIAYFQGAFFFSALLGLAATVPQV